MEGEAMTDDALVSGKAEKLRRRMLSPWAMRAFFLAKLPLALIAGLRISHLGPERCEVRVPFAWRTQNPFRSIYFAALAMAAELSTGAPAMVAAESAPESVAMLIVGLTAEFEKKASDVTTFICEDLDRFDQAILETLESGEGVTAQVATVGYLPDGEVAARFAFTWSFKRRRQGEAAGQALGDGQPA